MTNLIKNSVIGMTFCMVIVEEYGVIVQMSELFTSLLKAKEEIAIQKERFPECRVYYSNFTVKC